MTFRTWLAGTVGQCTALLEGSVYAAVPAWHDERTFLSGEKGGHPAWLMKKLVRVRLAELVIAVAMVIAAFVFTERYAWHQIASLRDSLRPVRVEQIRASNQLPDLLEEADASLVRLQRSLFLSLFGLLFCGVTVLALAYRRMVGPLHSSLAESRTLIERQEKLASLGVFATGIAHEIRNPITAIKVRLFTLKTSYRPDASEHEDLEVIESEINRLERIVQEFLRFARPAEPDLLTMPIDPFLREVYSLLTPELAKRSVRFELDLQANEPVQIDPEKMKQVLLNFIQNAADSIEHEGTVTLRSRTDRQTLGDRVLDAVVVEISDTGRGMPIEVQRRLFDPFFTTKEKGTGLGLPIAARIVEKHGGLIQYQTQPGKGTTFSVLLPRVTA